MSDVKFSGRMTNFSKISFNTDDAARIKTALDQLLGDNPENKGALVVIDSSVRQDIGFLLQTLRQYGLQVCAVLDGMLAEQAMVKNLPILPREGKLPKVKANTVAAPTVGMVVHELVRSGARVQANGDLLLLNGCNPSTEVIAGGNLSIWGSAQGRLIAGTEGDTAAVVVCQQFNAELVAIAGTYIVAEDFPTGMLGHAVKVYLNAAGSIEFMRLG